MADYSSLPTSVSPGQSGHNSDHALIHEAVRENLLDTGWKSISSYLINGWAMGSGNNGLHIRRFSKFTLLRLRHVTGASAVSNDLLEFSSSPVKDETLPKFLMPSDGAYQSPMETAEPFGNFWALRYTTLGSHALTFLGPAEVRSFTNLSRYSRLFMWPSATLTSIPTSWDAI